MKIKNLHLEINMLVDNVHVHSPHITVASTEQGGVEFMGEEWEDQYKYPASTFTTLICK